MNKEEKTDIDLDIFSLIKKITEGKDPKDGVMYLRGDSEFNNAVINIQGDVRLLSQTIQHHITVNDEFRRFIFATVGSYLVKEPLHEQEFLRGIEEVKKHSPGIN
jgi:hypothetical protein